MDTRKRIESHDPLAEPLRREAHSMRPVFSELLDARLRAALQTAATAAPYAAVESPRTFRGQLLSWAAAAAVSIALLVASALFWHSQAPHPPETIVQNTPIEPVKPPAGDIESTTDFVENTATDLGQWMTAAVDDNQWAGLDRDAQTAMATVTGSLPFDLSVAIAAADPSE